MASFEELASGRYRATVKIGGRGGHRERRTFDHRYEAVAWALDVEERAAAAVGAPRPPAPAAAQDGPPAAPLAAPAPASSAPSIHAHGTAMVDRIEVGLVSSTVKEYRRHLRALEADGLGLLPMTAVTRGAVQEWQTRAKAAYPAGQGAATVNARLKFIRMVYIDAMTEGVVPVGFNPADKVKNLATSKRPPRILSDAERHALLAAAPAEHRLPILLALDCGLRWSEVFGLPASAVRGEFIDVWQVLEREERTLREYDKGHRRRVVPFGTPETLAEVTAHAAEVTRERGRNGLMFTNSVGNPVDYHRYRRRFDALLDSVMEDAPGFHGLRHTYGSTLAAEGVPRKEIAVLMGHADEETTAIYVHEGEDGHRRDLVTTAFANRKRRHLEAVSAA